MKALCQCGCGNAAPIAGRTYRKHRVIKGQPRRFLRGHWKRTHGFAQHTNRSVEYKIWTGMRSRCSNPRLKTWGKYGGIGIKVCERWNDFVNFLSDMGIRPSRKHSIDRFPDPYGNYEPGNCRWATPRQQRQNRRRYCYSRKIGPRLKDFHFVSRQSRGG